MDHLLISEAQVSGHNELGPDTRVGDGHRQAWAPTLLTQVQERSPVDGTASEAEKAALVRSLFGARSDGYATRWEG